MSHPSAAELAAATPVGRDRVLDLLRVAALAAVMLGHFLMSGVEHGADGEAVVVNTLLEVPAAQPLTWVLQVLPVFFMVGGAVHAKALPSLAARGGGYAEFVAARARRLLVPTLAFVVVGMAVGLAAELVGTTAPVDDALRLVGQPLWFVGIYLLVISFAPAMFRWHQRAGARVVVMLVAAVVVVDVLRLGFDVPLIGFVNYLLVWAAVHQLGFFYAEGTLRRRRVAGSLALAGLASAVLLVALGPYPMSMISLEGEEVSNLSPPSLAALALAIGQIGVLVLLHEQLTKPLQRPRVWLVVVAANGVVMTTFLWHLTAIVLVNAAWVQSGLPMPAIGGRAWWLTRLPLLVAVVAVLALLVVAFRRFESPGRRPEQPPPGGRGRDLLAVVGLTVAIVGVLGFAITGFSGVVTMATRVLVVLPMTPWLGLALLGVGLALVARSVAPRRRSGGSARSSGRADPTSAHDRTGPA